ncbi:related to purine utilization positive regulator [Cephalotrichum gorgonifer]|uniref:Related to purine utilization positive regulator n=1 Tax=Cephalotrichum gorgonifer TaxID=2041049 RepID=A0AAE8N5B8_9PEZI|nr:related to purine utilization positive regulator [Cephalotrichum gorgonifer]
MSTVSPEKTEEVANLTEEIGRLRALNDQAGPDNSRQESPQHELVLAPHAEVAPTPTDLQDWMTTSLGRVVCEPLNQPQFFGVSSGITLARLVLAAIRIDNPPAPPSSEQQQRQQALVEALPGAHAAATAATAAAASPATNLPPRNVAEHLVRVYFEYRTPHLPIVSRSRLEQALDGAYLAERDPQAALSWEASRDLVTSYLVFAIALCDIHHPSRGRPPQSEDCFDSAMREVNKVLSCTKSPDALRCLLLLCQYVALCPTKGSLWLVTGAAMRLVVDLGLHWETEGSKGNMDPDLLDDRRRLWWSTYLFDRMLCITLGRPFGMADQGINVGLPTPDTTKLSRSSDDQDANICRAHNFLIRITQMESEIKHVLYSQFRGSSLAYPRANYALWIVDIRARLQEWYNEEQQSRDSFTPSVFSSQAYWDAVYNNALLLLYRPNPISPQPSQEALHASFNAACKLITSIRTLHRGRKIDIPWIWVHHLFMAGLTVIYGLWQSEELRGLAEARSSISTLQACGSTLSALSERWDGAAGCRDAFENLSSATIDWLITSSAEETRKSRVEFEKQLRGLQRELPTAFSDEVMEDDPFTILTAGNFAFQSYFDETLNSGGDWLASQDVDFGDWC